MKHLLFLLLIVPNALVAQSIYHVTAPKATVYGLPNSSSTVNSQLKRGDELQYLKLMESGAWAKVQVDGKIGYIEIISIAEGKFEKKVKAATSKKYHVSVFQSAVYKKQNFSSGKIETLSENSLVEVIGDAGEWGKVRTSTGIGYVYMAHLTEGAPKKAKKTKEIKVEYYSVKFDCKMLDQPSNNGKTLQSLSRGEGVEVTGIIGGAWAKVKLPRGFGYINTSNLEKDKGGGSAGSGSGSNVKMKDIGKAKNPKKVGAICRDGSTDYKVGPNTCSKGNGVKIWIYQAPK
ncbi:MAG: SH3 domain-containing protein [Bacteroidia bacterium]